MEAALLDQVEVDFPDPGVKRLISLVERGETDSIRWTPAGNPSDARLEMWDDLFARESSVNSVACTVTIELDEIAWLPSLFHAAVSWLGTRDVPIEAVQICVGAELLNRDDWLASFDVEKTRHLSIEQMDLPDSPDLLPKDQYRAVRKDSWKFAVDACPGTRLSARQIFAIRLYTLEFYLSYHRALRNPDAAGGAIYWEMMPLIAVMDAGLENLPPEPGRTFRGEWNRDPEKTANRRSLEEGGAILERSYLSSSLDERHVLLMRSGFLFRIDGETGRDISMFSPFVREKEILFGRGLIQRINRIIEGEDKLSIERDFETTEANPGWRLAGE